MGKDLTVEEESTPLNARLAIEATLLFHSGSPWDDAKRTRWEEICRAVLGEPKFGDFEATTRTLCDLARKALGHSAR